MAAIARRDVAKAAKLRGLTFNAAAVDPIVRTLKSEMNPHESLLAILDNVKAHLEANPGTTAPLVFGSLPRPRVASASNVEETMKSPRLLQVDRNPVLIPALLAGTSRIVTEDTITHVIADMSKDDGDKNMERFQVGATNTRWRWQFLLEPPALRVTTACSHIAVLLAHSRASCAAAQCPRDASPRVRLGQEALFHVSFPPAHRLPLRSLSWDKSRLTMRAHTSAKPENAAFSSSEDAPSGGALHSGPESKVAMLRDRFLLVQQRLQRNEMFCKPLIASTNRDYIEVGTAGGIDGVPASESRCLLIVPRRSGNKRPPLSLSLSAPACRHAFVYPRS